jgi:hypothetical protein
MQKRRLTLITALLLSVLLHFVVVAGGEFAWPDFYTSPDEVLASKKAEHIQRVQIMSRPPAAKKAASGTRFVNNPPAKAKKKKTAAPKPEAEKVAETAAAAATPEAETTAPEAPVETPPAPPPPVELAPAFPVQLAAELELRVDGLSAVLKQTWVMEGFRYFIDMNGKKFGFRLQVTSEGSVNPEGGLRPEHSRLLLNGKVQNFTDYADGMVRYGKAGSPREQPLAVPPQDMASLPFHVAVTFNGQPMTLLVTTGKRIYEVRMTVLAEETLKLPVGTLRTLHLQGERYDPEAHTLIRDYDIWLAPDYLNFPVKFIGQSGSGNRYEYRLKALEIEGKLVLGQKDDGEAVTAEEAIPEWIRQRTQTEGLNNP